MHPPWRLSKVRRSDRFGTKMVHSDMKKAA